MRKTLIVLNFMYILAQKPKIEDFMGGMGSGRTSKVGRRPSWHRKTNEIYRLRSYDMMNSRLEKKNLMMEIILSRGATQVFKIFVTPKEFTIYDIEKESSKEAVCKRVMKKVCLGGATNGCYFLFPCPCCQRHCVYLYWDGRFIGCQKCHELIHPTQSMSNENRWLWKEKMFLKRHGLTRDNMRWHERPKGMHRKKFHRLWQEWSSMDTFGELLLVSHHHYPLAYAALKEEYDEDDEPGPIALKAYHVLTEFEQWASMQMTK